jgi:hypothetical protein
LIASAVLLFVLAFGAAAARGAALRGVNIAGLSFEAQLSEPDQDFAVARSLHATVVRVEVPWAVMEPQGPGQIDAGARVYMDRTMADAAAAHIKVIAVVRSTPCWASSAPAALMRKCSRTGTTAANSWPPRKPATYGAFVAYLAARYGTQLAAIEVWNEPDQTNELYFAGPDKVHRYAAILRAAYPAIKRANPHVLVLGGSLVGSNGVFLRALYAAGIKGFYDGISVHFYNLTLASLRSIHEVQLANGDATPLWLDEFGWTSCWPQRRTEQEQACVTAATQALNIANVLRSLASSPWVAAAVIFKLRDSFHEEFGLLNAAGKRKPAFTALARVLGSRPGAPSHVSLSLGRRHGSVVASGSAPVGDFMALEAFQHGVLRYTAVFVLDRFNRYSITLPPVLGTSGLSVRIVQYWSGTPGGAQRSI